MKTNADRPWRKYRFHAALPLVAAILALAAGPAQGETGGASSAAAGEAEAGTGIAFTPMRWAGATWYGPGLYGSHTACGQVLRPHTIGVAHRNLPCGTAVKFVYHGRAIVTRVIDRGPYSHGNAWDLTNGAPAKPFISKAPGGSATRWPSSTRAIPASAAPPPVPSRPSSYSFPS